MNYYRSYDKNYECLILARVSDLKQEESGLSIPAQLSRITEYTTKLGFDKPKIFTITESSTKDNRAKFEKIIDYISNSKKTIVLVIDTIDRLQRSFKESVTLEKYWKSGKLELHFYRESLVIHKESNSSDLIRWDMGVMFARSYVLQLSDNVKRATGQKLRNGEWPQKAPFGYKNITKENGKKWVIPHEFNSIVVRKLYEWYSTGSCSMLGITQKANEEFKLNLSKGHIDYILKRKFYYGVMVYNDKLYPHCYEKIISKELYDMVQMVKAGYHKKPFKYADKPYTYRGLITCSICGYVLTGEPHKGMNYYHCTMYGGKHQALTSGKRAEWVREDRLTEQFAETLFKRIQVPQDVLEDVLKTIKATHEGKMDMFKEKHAHLTAEYTKYERSIDFLFDERAAQRITAEFYDRKYKEYRDKQAEIKEQLDRLESVDDSYFKTASTLLELANRAYDLFLGSELDEKRQLLGFVLQNCNFDGVKLNFTLKKPFDTLALCAKRQTWLRGRDSNPEPRS